MGLRTDSDVGIFLTLWINYRATVHRKDALDRSSESEVAIVVGPVVECNVARPVYLRGPQQQPFKGLTGCRSGGRE